LIGLTTVQALHRYEAMHTGWSWDLAYYNQWFWALTHGFDKITVNPVSAYADEGPWIWKTNYLAPVRLLIAPLYALEPDPRTLLVIQNVVFWLIVPASFSLVRSETHSTWAALSAAALVPLTPLIWPLVWNDFRELQIALPFVLWALQGVRSRSLGISSLGIGGMLACRQEFAVVVATFGLIPSRDEEDLSRTYRWANALLVLGSAWFLLGFFGYLSKVAGSRSTLNYLAQFTGPKPWLSETLSTGWTFLALGLGVWTLFMALAPRVALVMFPWWWSLSSGRWSLDSISTEEWHHVRYTAPMVALGLAAGLVGYSRLAGWLLRKPRGGLALGAIWLVAAVGSVFLLTSFFRILEQQPHPMGPEEVREVWSWIEQVGPDDGVIAAYEVTAPLSSRKRLYSYILSVNPPKGFPWLGKEFQWIFYRNKDAKQPFEQQGFEIVHKGPLLTIYHRGNDPPK
jgi:hypothetical protein